MAVYDEFDKKQWIAFYTSPDLKAWTFRSRIEGFYECPDLFELPVDGDPAKRKWVLTAADSDYRVGAFDGGTFTPETGKLTGSRGRAFYAAQTFTNVPDGRVIQVGWLRAESPKMPFNQAMSVPLELRLVGTPDGPRLARRPVKELQALRDGGQKFGPLDLKTGDDPLKEVTGEALEVRADLAPKGKAVVTLTVRGVLIEYDAGREQLTVAGQKATVPLRDGKLRLTVLADRTVYEVFAADGLVYLPVPVIPKADDRRASLTVAGEARVESVEVYGLKSVWAK
jgi:sucrose-6-phosphate hydrolase SacC (GH32 family)